MDHYTARNVEQEIPIAWRKALRMFYYHHLSGWFDRSILRIQRLKQVAAVKEVCSSAIKLGEIRAGISRLRQLLEQYLNDQFFIRHYALDRKYSEKLRMELSSLLLKRHCDSSAVRRGFRDCGVTRLHHQISIKMQSEWTNDKGQLWMDACYPCLLWSETV